MNHSSASSEAPRSALFNQSLEKGFDVLHAFGPQRRSMGLNEIALATGLNKSSAQRMVHTLERLGYLRRHPRTRRYHLAQRVMELGFRYLGSHPLVDAANPFLSELTKVTAETCALTEPDRLDMVYLARFTSPQFVPIHMPVGSRVPIYCTGSGRAYLSALPEAEARQLISQSDRRQQTPYTLTDVEAIMENLRQSRLRGYAVNGEELFLGDMTLAAPICDANGRPVGSVHVVAPTSRWSRERAEMKLAPALLQCALSLNSIARAVD